MPDAVVGELLVNMILKLFGKVNMHLPFLPCIAAMDASTEVGHGGAVASSDIDEVNSIARLACKSGGYVGLDDGPVLETNLARRLGPRHDLRLSLHNFHAIFSVRITAPGYINLEKTRVLIFYVLSVLRSRDHFCHRLLVLVDSKVVTGAVTKGRSSSVPLSGLLRRLAALCFAGGLLLHCVCVPKSHNPGDWSSRGLRLPGRRSRLVAVSWCPASGVAAQRHPLHMSKRLRGKGFSCGAAAFAHVGGDWWPQVVLDFLRRMEVKRHRGLLYRSFQGWAIIAVSRLH